MTQTLAHEVPVLDLTFKASEVMAYRYVAVMLGTNDDEVSLCTDGSDPIGILQDTAAAVGDSVRVRVFGVSLIKAGTTISKGDKCNSGYATGRLAVAGANEGAIAKALRAATADGDEIPAIIGHFWYAT
jgi:hypothetical protein